MYQLEIDNVSVNYGTAGGAKTLALSQVNLTMERGDFVVALGSIRRLTFESASTGWPPRPG